MCRDFWVEHRLSRLICRMVKSEEGRSGEDVLPGA